MLLKFQQITFEKHAIVGGFKWWGKIYDCGRQKIGPSQWFANKENFELETFQVQWNKTVPTTLETLFFHQI